MTAPGVVGRRKARLPGFVGHIMELTRPERDYLHAVNVAYRAGNINTDEWIAHAGEAQRLMDEKVRRAEE